MSDGMRDPRWIVLLENGEYVLIGRHREPDSEQISKLMIDLETNGLAGWLAVIDRSEHARGEPEIIMVRPLRNPQVDFDFSVKAFRDRRAERRS